LIVAIEGVDGAGKNTFARHLRAEIVRADRSVAAIAYPRYSVAPLGPAIRALLTGDAGLGQVASSPRATALLFALDRANSLPDLVRLAAEHDVVLVDRYLASNAVYGAARLPEAERDAFLDWIAGIELTDLGLPRPDLHVLLRVPAETAREQARARAAADINRAVDTFEDDQALQIRCAQLYDQAAAGNWISPWIVVRRDEGIDEGIDTVLAAVLAAAAG
jgi:dTMP kinase